jgi:3-polyprenyl-4-hydroxybenzoate decarboxylase
MTNDLHSFLKEFERDFPGEVVYIEKKVHARYEIAALVANTLRAKEDLR